MHAALQRDGQPGTAQAESLLSPCSEAQHPRRVRKLAALPPRQQARLRPQVNLRLQRPNLPRGQAVQPVQFDLSRNSALPEEVARPLLPPDGRFVAFDVDKVLQRYV